MRKTNTLRIALICLALPAWCFRPGQAGAQSRKDVLLSTPGATRLPGASGSQSFLSYSFGLGSLQSHTPGGETSVLRSSVSGPANYNIGGIPRSQDPVSPLLTPALRPAPSGTEIYKPAPGLTGLPDSMTEAPPIKDNALFAAHSYLAAMSASATSSLSERNKPVTSLAPPGDNLYARYLRKGESAFRMGNYQEAFGLFRLANDIGGHDPESLLSMAQAEFASARFSYALAAHFLRRGIKHFPELPLVPLQPRGFFGDKGWYAQQLIRLEDHVQRYPADADALLLVAYLHWFDGGVAVARDAVTRAFDVATETQNADMVQALQVFWDGMVASGKVSGRLQPTTRPTSDQPADALPSTAPADESP